MTTPIDLRMAAHLVNAAHAQLHHAQRHLYAALERRAERPGRQPGDHGTPAGYRRHQRAEEPPCWACMEAHNWDLRRRDMRRRVRAS